MTKAQLTALRFVSTHRGQRYKAFPWGFRYYFDAPELKRAPFHARTLEKLMSLGLVTRKGDVRLTLKGESVLRRHS